MISRFYISGQNKEKILKESDPLEMNNSHYMISGGGVLPKFTPFFLRLSYRYRLNQNLYIPFEGEVVNFDLQVLYPILSISLRGYTAFEQSFYYSQRYGPYISKRDLIVWDILGRVTHLLGDMGVPAHAHNDTHPPGIDGDPYELDYMTVSKAKTYTVSMAKNDGGLLDVYGKYDPLRYLFYTVNQIADWFDSGDEGFWGLFPGDNTYNSTFHSDYYQELVSKMQELGIPQHTSNYDKCARNSYIMSMRAMAGLFYWFASEVDILDPPPTTSCTLTSSENWCGDISLTGNVLVPSNKTLTIKSTANIDFNGYYIRIIGSNSKNNIG